jgi:hypothetical protein
MRHASWPEHLFLLISLRLSATAAYVSVYFGMTVLFPAAGVTIIVLGGFIEAAKFVGFGVVSAGWSAYGWLGKSADAFLLGLAAVVNAAAVYGWLISSHAGPAAERSASYNTADAGAGAKAEIVRAKLDDAIQRIRLIDDAAEGAAKRGRSRAALNAIDSQKKTRTGLVAERDRLQQELADAKAGRTNIASKRQVDEASALPIRYAALLFEDIGMIAPGTDPEKLMRWLAFMILMCGDPLALAAMWMVNSRARRPA